MTEMVNSPLHFKAFFCGPALWKGHHACIVNQVIEPRERDAFDEGVNRAAAGEVKRNELYLCIRLLFFDRLNHLLCGLSASCSNDHLAAQLSQFSHRLCSDTRISASNDCILAGEVRLGATVLRTPKVLF